MRSLLAIVIATIGAATTVSAQTLPRVDIGPVVRVDKVTVQRGVSRTMPVFGVAASIRLSETWGVEGEVTQAGGGEFARSRDAISETFAPAGSSIAEIERLGVLARERMTYRAGVGWSAGVTARTGTTGRANMVFRLGLTSRTYAETWEHTTLRIPEGIDPSRLAGFAFGNGNRASNPWRGNAQRGGFLMGIDVPIRITQRLSLAPLVRYVYGSGPDGGDDGHRELSIGVRSGWRF